MPVPPRPTTPPAAGTKNVTKTRNGGGFNPSLNPSFSLNVPGPKTGSNGPAAGSTAGQAQAPAGSRGGGVPGSDFMSNEDIQKFCEHLRKQSRTRATERAMDADHLEAVLRTIPDVTGGLGGSRARARRVTRPLKKIAAAEKVIQKNAALVYATFEREFDSNLRKVGKGRVQPTQPSRFGWR